MSGDHVVVRKEHLRTALGKLRRCACGKAAAKVLRHRGPLPGAPAYYCDDHFVGQQVEGLEDLPHAEAVRALQAAREAPRPDSGSRSVMCPYEGIAFSKVPSYKSGYGCPVCKGLAAHVELWGSSHPADLSDIEHAVAHIELLKGRLEEADRRVVAALGAATLPDPLEALRGVIGALTGKG